MKDASSVPDTSPAGLGLFGRRGRSYPIRALLLWLMVVLVGPALLLAAISAGRVTSDSRFIAERRLLGQARELTRAVDATLDRSLRRLEAMAASPSIDNGDFVGFRAEALRYLGAEPTWDVVILSQPDGTQLTNTGSRPDGTSSAVADLDSLRRLVQTGAPVIGSLRAGPDGTLGLPLRVPVVRAGELRYVLSAVITPDRLASLLPIGVDEDEHWLRVVIDASNVIVARTRAPAQYVGQLVSSDFAERLASGDELLFQSVTLDGEQVYSGVSRGAVSGWRGVVAVPRAALDVEFRQTMTLLGTVGALLLGLGGLASYLIARWISRDIAKVSRAASALVRGEMIEPTPSRVEEVRQLSSALLRSAELIRTREQERDARVAQADAARAEAETAARAKDEFLAMLGHELRNPLAPVLDALRVAEASGGGLGERERRVVERQVRHMARLVDDLLDMARIYRGPVELMLSPCSVAAIVNESVEMTRAMFDQQGQTLSVEVPEDLELDCDSHRVTQVLSNLLANASKYTAAGGAISLSARRDADHVVISCADNGVGLGPEMLTQVFEPFVQGARSLDRRQGGLGLGLAVARGLVEQHGGEISAHSPGEGLGTRFVVRLPVRQGREVAQAAAAESRPLPSVSARVLVVEDNEDAREMLVLALSMGGAEVRGVGSAAAALAAVAEWRPQVAVLDIGLPDMDGYQLARRLRETPGGATMQLMALTGYGGEASAAEARGAGFDRFFVKPVSVDALLDAIAHVSDDPS